VFTTQEICNKIEPSAYIHNGTVSLCTVMYISQWFDFFEREVDCFAPLGSPAPSGAGPAYRQGDYQNL
jgi:hypothetical protein